MRTRFSGNEPTDEFGHRIIVIDSFALAMIVILGHDDVAGIANDVDDSGIARIETLVTLDYARPGHAVKMALRGGSGVGNQLMDVAKICVLIGKHKVCHQET